MRIILGINDKRTIVLQRRVNEINYLCHLITVEFKHRFVYARRIEANFFTVYAPINVMPAGREAGHRVGI